MSRVVRSTINSAIISERANALFFNIRDKHEPIGFDFNIYTFDNFEHENITRISKQDVDFNLDLEFDFIVNLRPYDDNLTEILKFSKAIRLPIYNYIIDIGRHKKEILMRKSQLLERFNINYFGSADLANQVFLPNKQIGTKKDFSDFING